MLSTLIWGKKKGSLESSYKVSPHEGGLIMRNLEKPIFYINDESIQLSKFDVSSYHDNHHQYAYSFLKSCNLCHKPLILDKEVYIYRGDLGFCSVECRNRQVYLNKMKKIEISTKRILASFHQRRRGGGGGRCESVRPATNCRLRHPFSYENNCVN